MPRRTAALEQRSKFYIFTNGKSTEKTYFTLIKKFKSQFDVSIKYCNSDPESLVREAKTVVGKANQVWCAFDVDLTYREGRLVPAIGEARAGKVKIAFSNMAFEVWLLSHFCIPTKSMSNPELIKELNGQMKKNGVESTYEKTNEELIKKVFLPKIANAINNAKVQHQTWIKEHNEKYSGHPNHPIWDWNPCTNVYELVEALQLSEI